MGTAPHPHPWTAPKAAPAAIPPSSRIRTDFSFLARKGTSAALGREGIWEKAGYKTLSKVPLGASGLKLIGATHNPLLERDGRQGGRQGKNNGQIPMPCCRRVLQVCEVQCIGNEVETQHVCREHGSEVTFTNSARGAERREAGQFASQHSQAAGGVGWGGGV